MNLLIFLFLLLNNSNHLNENPFSLSLLSANKDTHKGLLTKNGDFCVFKIVCDTLNITNEEYLNIPLTDDETFASYNPVVMLENKNHQKRFYLVRNLYSSTNHVEATNSEWPVTDLNWKWEWTIRINSKRELISEST